MYLLWMVGVVAGGAPPDPVPGAGDSGGEAAPGGEPGPGLHKPRCGAAALNTRGIEAVTGSALTLAGLRRPAPHLHYQYLLGPTSMARTYNTILYKSSKTYEVDLKF